MKSIIKLISKLISLIIPTSKVLVFHSMPDYSDNSYAVYQHIINSTQYSNYELVWLISIKEKVKDLKKILEQTNQQTLVVYQYTIKACWYYYRAKYIFCTHGVFNDLTLYQNNKFINLWHGMPLKVIGYMDKFQKGQYPIRVDITIATSEKFKTIIAKSFHIDEEQVYLIGQPRNDLLFEQTSFFEKYNIDTKKYTKIGIWLPTYRKAIFGEFRIDGNYNEGQISFLGLNDLDLLDNFLQKSGILLILKRHQMDVLQMYSFPKYNNILILKTLNLNIQMYPLLGNTDFLLTDYSSVWVDYEMLKKPIGFVMDDIKEYENSRGFTIDNLNQMLPGPILSTLEQLKNFLINTDKYIYETGDLFNKYKDNLSSTRLLEKLQL
jgi:CDP-glycerol glycerophosphotransferase (TagB/SpsB family)